jgi:predicted alpha/beta hydrolase family esterase
LTEVLFIQGGGEGTHDRWDNRLADSLRDALGDGFTVRYPRITAEADPDYATWKPDLLRALADTGDDAMIVAHSIGGTLLLRTLAEAHIRPRALFLIAAPFAGEVGWPGDGMNTGKDLQDLTGVPVYLYHGDADEEVPIAHLDLYAALLPQALIRRLPGRDHQLNNDLSEVAHDIRGLMP